MRNWKHIPKLQAPWETKRNNEYVRLTLDKLPIICADLVRTDDDWQKWNFWQFRVRKLTDRNPIPLVEKRKLNPTKRERLYQTSQDDWYPEACVYSIPKDNK